MNRRRHWPLFPVLFSFMNAHVSSMNTHVHNTSKTVGTAWLNHCRVESCGRNANSWNSQWYSLLAFRWTRSKSHFTVFRKHCIQPLIAFVPIRIRVPYSWNHGFVSILSMRAFHGIPIWNQGWFTWKRRFRLRIELHMGMSSICTQHVSRISIHCFACWKLVLSLVHLKASRDYLPLTYAGMYMLLLVPRFHLYPTIVSGTANIQRLICRACLYAMKSFNLI